MIRSTFAVLLGCLVAHGANATVGNTTIEASVDNNADGQAEAFPATAQTGGSLTALNVYLDASNGARTVVVGLYSSNTGRPGALLTQATITGPVAAAWNSVAVSPVAISSGSTYWIAILGLNGGIQFRDRAAGPCSSVTSQQTTLSALPSAWTTGASWPTCPISAYGTISGDPPPAISVTISPTTASVQSGHTAQFAAMINGVASNAVSWTATGGAITSSGLYTAGASSGTFSVTATSTTDSTKSASAFVTVTAPPPPAVSVSISPTTATVAVGGIQPFTATVTGTTNTSVRWATTGGTISTAGVLTAPTSTGTITVTATSLADSTKSASATVSVIPAPPATLTLGDSTIESSGDNNSDGQAEAFPVTAQTGGTLSALNVYLDPTNGAHTVIAGLYSSNGHPATLLTSGTIASPKAGAWNTASVAPVPITAGTTYWIAILGLNGGIQFRDKANGGCNSETSQQGTLTSLPSSWTSGSSFPSCPASVYGTLSNAAPGTISISVSPVSASVPAGGKAQFTAMINGSASNAVSWTAGGGAITSAGLYTAGGSPGTFAVKATSTADNTKSASASVVVTVPPPSVAISVAPISATLAPGATQLFTANVAGSTNTNVTWTATGGTVSVSGLYTAGSAPGTFSVTATSAADQTKSASASVTVTVPGTSTLAQTAASMQPGTWAPLTTNNFGGGNILRPPDGGSGLEFNERAVWNPVNNTAMILGGSHPGASTNCNSTFLAAYTESTNTWANNLPSPCPNFDDSTAIASTNLGHPYDHQAIDSNGNLYHRQYSSGKVMVFSQPTQAWSQCSPFNTSGFTTNSWGNFGEFQVAASLVYFPDRNSLILLDGDWGLWELPLAGGCNGQWTLLASTNGGGFSPQLTGLGSYHNIGQYSPLCRCVIIGGNSSQMYKIDVNDNIAKLASSPVFLGIPQNPGTPLGAIYTVDPVSGHFLVWSGNNSDDGTAYDYNPLTDSWSATGIKSPIFPAPEGGVTETVAIPISRYGVIMFVQAGSASGGAVYLYKHASSSSGTPAISVSVAPATASIQANRTVLFSASVFGTSNTAVTWIATGGTISGSGLYTAGPASGTFSVTATSTADSTKSASATVTVTPPPLPSVSVSISPTTATVAVGAVQSFTAAVAGTVNTSVNWATTGGMISTAGVLTAPSTTGTITVTATSLADSTKSASATVNVVPLSPGTVNGWTSRTSGVNVPGGPASVVGTQSFDSFPVTNQQQYFQMYDPVSITTDCSVAADGCSLKFSVLKGYQQGEPGWLNWNFSPDLSKTFGNGQEFYIQYRYRVDAGMLNGANFPNSEGFKAHILTEGDTASVQAGDCGNSPGELVLQQDGAGSAFPIMYHNCGFSGGQFNFMQSGYQLITLPGIIGTNFLDQNMAGCPHYDGRGIPTSDPTCFNYAANEWMTVQVHVKVGAFNSPNSAAELWLAHQGQPAELVVNASDAALVNDGSGGASGRYGKIALLPYQTNMSGSLVDTAVWYDDLMVSTRRIPDPDVASPNAPDSLTVSSSANSVLVGWRVNSANGTPQDDTGFVVERCTGDGTVCFPNPQTGFIQIGVTAPAASAYTDSTVVPGTTYTYRVRARNTAGNSGYAASQCFNALAVTCGSTISIP